ncbi:MAG: hypothetical protein IPL79_10350 [Myxococcales bacterium]|nr:hypothetical protein [Myxococcales bacterium]
MKKKIFGGVKRKITYIQSIVHLYMSLLGFIYSENPAPKKPLPKRKVAANRCLHTAPGAGAAP